MMALTVRMTDLAPNWVMRRFAVKWQDSNP